MIDENGEMLGVYVLARALEKAQEKSLDLVEISPNAAPPVCKIMDYGKFKFQEQKKKAEAKKKQKAIEVKEIKLTPRIETHDYQVKLKKILSFCEAGDRVKVSMRFRGREMNNNEIGIALLNRICEDVKEVAKPESPAKFEGRQAIMFLVSTKSGG